MVYDSSGLYTMGYDVHNMHGGVYGDPTNIYLPQPPLSMSQSSAEVNFVVSLSFIFLLLFCLS